MTEHTADPVTQDGSGTRPEPPRLTPRPLERPEVDAEAAAVFGRPHGVDGAFAAPANGVAANGAARSAGGETTGRARRCLRPSRHRRGAPSAPATARASHR